jgi:hypothetical protein
MLSPKATIVPGGVGVAIGVVLELPSLPDVCVSADITGGTVIMDAAINTRIIATV